MTQDRTPEPPFPPNPQQSPPGRERTLSPRPRYEAPEYRAAGKPALRAPRAARGDRAYVYFASDADSRYVTGEILTLLGGQVRAA